MSSRNPLEQLRRLDRSSPDFHDQLCNVLYAREYERCVLTLQGDDLVWLVEYLDKALDILNPVSFAFQECLRELRSVCGTRMILPASYAFPSPLPSIGPRPIGWGGSGEVYEGTLDGSKVCIKPVRVYFNDESNAAAKTLYQEAVVWKRLKHKNIVPLLGITSTPLQLISERMPGGYLTEHVREHPDTDRLGLLSDIAEGLHFLHSHNVVHVDLKGLNIHVDAADHARITNFGLARVTQSWESMRSASEQHGHTARWTAPEILNGNWTYSKEADVFAFAMVMIETFTGAVPFYNSVPLAVMLAIMRGERPPRPTHPTLTDELWALAQHCWDQDPYLRPEVSKVLKVLTDIEPPPTTPAPEPNGVERQHIYLTPEDQGGSVQLDESENAWPRGSPQAMFQDPPSITGYYHSGGDGLVFPRVPAENVASDSGKEMSGLMEHRDPEATTLLRIRPSSSSTDEISQSSNELVLSHDPLPLNLAEIAADSQRRPDQVLVDRIDGMLDNVISDRDRRELLNILCKMCSRQRMVPKSMHTSDCLSGELVEEYGGGHATVFRGRHKGRPVAVKIVRLYLTSNFDKCFSEFCREAIAWRHLRHPNILPLLGVNLTRYQLAMISEWMDHGNVHEYVERYEGVNRVQLLVEAANGLEYMHSLHMVHGDLKGANILVNRSHRACIADFGLSTIIGIEHRAAANASLVSVASKISLMSFTAGGTTRWMSPELLDPERFGISDYRPTKQSDCYALGMVIYEVLCGNAPFWEITNEGAVINAIMNGDRPPKPEAAESLGFTRGLWGIVQRCWLADASARPDARSIISHLNHATWSWERRRLV